MTTFESGKNDLGIPELAADSASALRALCAEYKLSTQVCKRLEDLVRDLADWKQALQDMTMTAKTRATALQSVGAAALELQRSIESLPFDLRMKLDNCYFGLDSQEGEAAIVELLEAGLIESKGLDLGAGLVPSIIDAVECAMQASGLAGAAAQRPGRQSTVEMQADFIRCIATHVKPAGMVPSNAGRFRRLCEALFHAAGLTLSDRALRHFMTERRPTLKAGGFCL